jgi:PKD domain-containing protein
MLRAVAMLALLTARAQGAPAPPVCSLAPPLEPANFAIHYHGATSGCTQTSGTCLPGETIHFQAISIYDYSSVGCLLGYTWNFGDSSPLAGGSTSTHPFVEGTYSVQLTVTSAIATQASVTQPVTVSAVAPALSPLMLAGLVGSMLLIALVRLAR